MSDRKRLQAIAQIKVATTALSKKLDKVVESKDFPKEVFAYNPLDYAREAFFSYLDNYVNTSIDALFLGMNPGPNGMMQTGIPFGDIALVKSYLGISEGVKKPSLEHPKKPIMGFDWPKSEVSGTRLWGFFQSQYKQPKVFFKKFFVLNYCPLGFLSETGANVTPDKLNIEVRKKIETLCDAYLLEVAPLFNAKTLVGVGGYASKVFERLFPKASIATVLHPSPASPAANRGWAALASKQLHAAGLEFKM